MTILEQLAAYAAERTEQAKKICSLAEMKEKAESMPKGTFAFEKALQKQDIAFICECKKASPSKGGGSAERRDGEVAANLRQPLRQPAADSSLPLLSLRDISP